MPFNYDSADEAFGIDSSTGVDRPEILPARGFDPQKADKAFGLNNLTSVARQAQRRNPAEEGRYSDLSKRHGLRSDTVRNKLNEVEAIDLANKFNNASPTLRSMLQDLDFAGQARDDIDNLSATEAVLRGIVDIVARSPVEQAIHASGMAFEGAGRGIDTGMRLLARGMDEVLPESLDKYIWRQPDTPEWAKAVNITPHITGALQWEGRGLKQFAQYMGVPEDRKNLATDITGAVGQMAAQISMVLLNPALGSTALFAMGVDQQGERQEQLGVEGQSARTDWAMIMGGAVTMIAERTGLNLILNRVPPKIKNKIIRHIADIGMAGGIEAVEEVIEGIAHNMIAQAYYDPSAEIFKGLGHEALVAGGAGSLVRGIINAVTPGKDRAATQTDQQRQEALNSLIEKVALKTNNPKVFSDLMERLGADSGTDSVYLNPEGAKVFFQNTDVSSELMGTSSVQAIINDIDNAIEEGRDIQIPIEAYAVDLVGTEIQSGLQAHLRLDPDALTLDEQSRPDTQADIDSLAEMDAERREAGADVYNDMFGQLIGAGRGRAEAEEGAALWEAVVRSTVERRGLSAEGLSPRELYQRYSPSVGREIDPRLQKRARAVEGMDLLLDSLRAGDVPLDKDIFGKSVIQRITELGGILDEGGELDARDVDVGKVGRNRLARKDGRTLDSVAEDLLEDGYIDERSEKAVLDAIDAELRGDPVYQMGAENQELMNRRAELNELEEMLGQAGLDIHTMSNQEIRQAMEGQGSEGSFMQALTQSPVANDQNFGDAIITEEVTVDETGELVEVTHKAQKRFDQTMKRRAVVEQIRKCLHAT